MKLFSTVLIVALFSGLAPVRADDGSAELRAIIQKQAARIAALEKENAELKKRLGDIPLSPAQENLIGKWHYGSVSYEFFPNCTLKEMSKQGYGSIYEWKLSDDGTIELRVVKALGKGEMPSGSGVTVHKIDASKTKIVLTPIKDGVEDRQKTWILLRD